MSQMQISATVRRAAERLIDLVLVSPVRSLPALQKVVRYVAQEAPIHLSFAHARRARYFQLRQAFLDNGERSPYGRRARAELLEAFERIDADVFALTSPSDGLFLAEAVLSLECEGDLVECGCCAGASTAKLSLLAASVGRRLLVFDSFAGLPIAGEGEARDHDLRRAHSARWRPGLYARGLELVRENIARYGKPDVCHFHPGWFADTLTGANLERPIALAFTDVDLVSSLRDCLTALWPRLADGGVLFSHDVTFLKVLRLFSDVRFWLETLDSTPPILFGAGFGICDDSPHLGFCVKSREHDADYLSRLILYKGLPGGV
jgi:Macrocin-O-methyltransferase (TylF)